MKRLLAELYAKLRRHPVAVLLALIFVVYFVTRLVHLKSVPIFCDEAIYIRWSQRALHDGEFLVSLADGKPPLHHLTMIPFIFVLRDPLVAGRLYSVFCGAATVLGLFLIGRELKGPRLGLIAAFLCAICPYCLWYDRLALAESMILALFVFAVFFAVKAATSANNYYLIGSGVLTGLALLTKGTGHLLFLIVPFAYLARGPFQKGISGDHPLLRWGLAVIASLLLGYGIYSLLRIAPGFDTMTRQAQRWTVPLSEVLANPLEVFPTNIKALFQDLFTLMTPVLFAVCFIGLTIGIARKWRPAYFLGPWFLVACLAESLIAGYPFPRFFLVLVPPLLLGAAYAFDELMEEAPKIDGRRARAAVKAVGAIVALAVLVPMVIKTARIVSDPSGAHLPQDIRNQYLLDWTAGWGIDETVVMLERFSEDGPITVGAVGYAGTTSAVIPEWALDAYLFDNEKIDIYGIAPTDLEEFPANLEEAARNGRTYCVINNVERLPEAWPLVEIERFRKDGSDSYYMIVAEVALDD